MYEALIFTCFSTATKRLLLKVSMTCKTWSTESASCAAITIDNEDTQFSIITTEINNLVLLPIQAKADASNY
jgi:hypothetical protein